MLHAEYGEPRSSRDIWVIVTICIVALTCILTVATLVYGSSIATLAADDFTRGANYQNSGIIGSAVYEYGHWDGRFTSFIIEYLLAPVIREKWGYSLVLISVYVVSIAFIAGAAKNIGFNAPQATAIALSLYTIVLSQSRQLSNSLFWVTGVIENVISISIIVFLLSCVIDVSVHKRMYTVGYTIALSVLSFLAVGFHEMFGAMYLLVMTIVVAVCFVRNVPLKMWLVTPIATGAISLFIVITAPGNANRMLQVGKEHSLTLQYVVRKSARAFLNVSEVAFSIQCLVAFLILYCVVTKNGAEISRGKPRPGAVLVIVLMATFAMMLAPVLITDYLAPRTRDGVIFFGLFGLVVFAGSVKKLPFLEKTASSKWSACLAGLSLIWLSALVFSDNFGTIWHSRTKVEPHLVALDQRHALLNSLRGRRDASVSLAPIPDVGTLAHWADVTTDRERWLNQSVARFYGVGEVYLGSKNSASFGEIRPPQRRFEMLSDVPSRGGPG